MLFELIPFLLVGWLLVTPVLFLVTTTRTAILTAYLGAWMFLPWQGYRLAYFPDYDKVVATNLAVFLGILLFDNRQLFKFQPRWFDLILLGWLVLPIATSLANGLGLYDGLANVLSKIIVWGLPYLIGRIYFNDLASIRRLALALFVAGLVYTPFCLWEIRMSPQLNLQVYGYRPHNFFGSVRLGGYRPTVFMKNGLMLGMWMTITCLAGFWLWRSGAVRRLWGFPAWIFVAILGGTTILCRSAYAMFLLFLGLGVLFLTQWTRTRIFLVCFVLMVPVYMVGRSTGVLPKAPLLQLARALTNEARAQSLEHRLQQETIFVRHAMKRPIFGWGGWNRARPSKDEWQRGVDAFWVITTGTYGLLGLLTVTTLFLMPVVLLIRRYPAAQWHTPEVGAIAALCVVVGVQTYDNLLNAMYNPLIVVTVGGLLGLYASVQPAGARQLNRSAANRAPGAQAVPMHVAGQKTSS